MSATEWVSYFFGLFWLSVLVQGRGTTSVDLSLAGRVPKQHGAFCGDGEWVYIPDSLPLLIKPPEFNNGNSTLVTLSNSNHLQRSWL